MCFWKIAKFVTKFDYLTKNQLNGKECPLLKKKLQSKKGKEWRKIAHLEHIRIDGKLIE